MSARTARSIVAVSLLLLALPATTASAKTETKTVKGEVIFANGQRPDDPGNCSAVVFVQWADVPRTISAKAIYLFKAKEYTKVAPPPFHDTYKLVTTYTAPPGQHRIQVGQGWSDGPRPNTCEATTVKQRELFGTVATVELTLEVDPAVCKKAQSGLKAAGKAVTKAQSQLRKASSGKAKARARTKLTAAKSKRTKAAKRVGEVC